MLYWPVSYVFLFILKPFNNWLEGAREDLMDMFSVHTVEEIVVWSGTVISLTFLLLFEMSYFLYLLLFIYGNIYLGALKTKLQMLKTALVLG